MPTFADRGCRVTDPYGRILGFLDRTSLVFSYTYYLMYLAYIRTRILNKKKGDVK
jgi:hypothetical protein